MYYTGQGFSDRILALKNKFRVQASSEGSTMIMALSNDVKVTVMRPGSDERPLVSIVLPTYNRCQLLREALNSIQCQSLRDWELIVVDDGSCDATREVVAECTKGWPQRVIYAYQTHTGPGLAWNTGLYIATGRYIGFHSDDDCWLPHHLEHGVAMLVENPDVDCIFADYKIRSRQDGQYVTESAFTYYGLGRTLRTLNVSVRGKLGIVRDSRSLLFALQRKLMWTLQFGVYRAKVFENVIFEDVPMSEDFLAFIDILLFGYSIAYIENVHGIYQLHGAQFSIAPEGDEKKSYEILVKRVVAWQHLYERRHSRLSPKERREVRRQLARMIFWDVAYRHEWPRHLAKEAFGHYLRAIGWWPWEWRFWKTLMVCCIKYFCRKVTQRACINR